MRKRIARDRGPVDNFVPSFFFFPERRYDTRMDALVYVLISNRGEVKHVSRGRGRSVTETGKRDEEGRGLTTLIALRIAAIRSLSA